SGEGKFAKDGFCHSSGTFGLSAWVTSVEVCSQRSRCNFHVLAPTPEVTPTRSVNPERGRIWGLLPSAFLKSLSVTMWQQRATSSPGRSGRSCEWQDQIGRRPVIVSAAIGTVSCDEGRNDCEGGNAQGKEQNELHHHRPSGCWRRLYGRSLADA